MFNIGIYQSNRKQVKCPWGRPLLINLYNEVICKPVDYELQKSYLSVVYLSRISVIHVQPQSENIMWKLPEINIL